MQLHVFRLRNKYCFVKLFHLKSPADSDCALVFRILGEMCSCSHWLHLHGQYLFKLMVILISFQLNCLHGYQIKGSDSNMPCLTCAKWLCQLWSVKYDSRFFSPPTWLTTLNSFNKRQRRTAANTDSGFVSSFQTAHCFFTFLCLPDTHLMFTTHAANMRRKNVNSNERNDQI